MGLVSYHKSGNFRSIMTSFLEHIQRGEVKAFRKWEYASALKHLTSFDQQPTAEQAIVLDLLITNFHEQKIVKSDDWILEIRELFEDKWYDISEAYHSSVSRGYNQSIEKTLGTDFSDTVPNNVMEEIAQELRIDFWGKEFSAKKLEGSNPGLSRMYRSLSEFNR